MEANVCDINHLDADVLLPPRKRLLAGLKKQNSDVYSSTPSLPIVSSPGCDFDIRLNNLLKFHFGDSSRSNEEIAEASRLAALEAVKAAKAARAIAEEKAAKAAKAVAAAKSALELVSTLSDEGTSRDKHLKRNKMKKHVPVQMLYNKNKGTDNCRTDEELARTLHRAINSSPRILKNSTSNSRNQKHKRLKRSSPSEKTKLQNGSKSLEGSRPSTSNGNGFTRERESDRPISEKDLVRVDLNTKFNKSDHTKMENGEASHSSKADYVNTDNKERESIMSKEKFGDSVNDGCSIGKKKARLKQKKLPISICSFRDQASPKEDLKSKSSLSFNENINKGQNQAYRYQCQHNVLDIVACEMILQNFFLHSEVVTKESSKSLHNGSDGCKVATAESSCNLKVIFGVWCGNSLDADTIKTFVSFEYDDSVKLRARVAAGLFAVRVMCKVKGGDRGSLSVSLVDIVTNLWQKLRKLPAFSELMVIYTNHGYSGEDEVDDLILNDLFYHLQGELEGRQISHMPFKELSQYLLQSNFLQTYHRKNHEDIFSQIDGVCLYDTDRLQGDMGIDFWDLSDWKASKEVAEMLLLSLQNVNVMVSLTTSKLSALIALATTFSISENDNSLDNEVGSGRKIPEKSLSSSIDNICQSLHRTIELLPPVSGASEDIVDILAAQAEFLFHYTRSLSTYLSLSACLLILKTSGYGLKVLSNCRPLVTGVIFPMKIFLMLILFSLKSCWRDSCLGVQTKIEHNEALPEAANVSLGLLPLICNCIELTEHCSISVIITDQILKGFSTPATWFPIIQKHLPMQRIVLKLQDKNSYSNIGIILKFLLTIAHVKEGAEMLVNTGFFASLSVLLADLSNGRPFSEVERERNLANTFENNERAQPIWGLSLAVVTAIINSLGESSIFNMEHVVTYFLLEKADLISYYLSAPDFPPDDHDKKRLRALKPHISLSALREIENTVMLICVLAKHRNTWSRAMKEMESQLRERCIHLLAFISCGTPRHGESPGRVPPIFCHPTLREEYEWHKKPSSINSKNGWFSFSAHCCSLNPKYSSFSSRTATVIKDQPNEHANLTLQTHFSDAMSIQIYRITCLLLNFLCQQAEDAAQRAEEVGFVDLAHFPELPTPDILHCLQDQGISIVTELCEANKLKQVTLEIQGVCILLLQITVMALYLEFCVIQICGMRPVHGRVEDFSKEFYALTKAMEGHAFLKESMNSLKQMVSFVYPELLQSEDVL